MPLTPSQLRWRFFGGWGNVFLVVVFAVLAGIVGTLLVVDRLREARFASAGERVVGRVTHAFTKQERDSKGRLQTHYWVSFGYTTKDGQKLSQSHTVGSDCFATLHPGGQVEVEYLRDAPQQSRIYVAPEKKSKVHLWVLGLLGAAFGGAAFAVLFFGWRNAGRQARLTLEGVAVPGEVLQLEQRRRGRTINYQLHFRFADPLGHEHEAEIQTLPNLADRNWQPGDAIAVICDEADPTRFIPDWFRVRGGAGRTE